MQSKALYTFNNTHNVILGEKAMIAKELPVEVIPIPAAVSAGCGLCLVLPTEDLQRGIDTLESSQIEIQNVYKDEEGCYSKLY